MPTLFSKFYENMFGAAQMWAVFSDDHRFISWPATEPAVAKVEKYFALTPEPAAASIAEVARLVKLDLPAMRGRMRARRFTHPPVCSSTGRGLRPRDRECGIHWGATTQDMGDTGLVLRMRERFAIIEGQLRAVTEAGGSWLRGSRQGLADWSFQQQAAWVAGMRGVAQRVSIQNRCRGAVAVSGERCPPHPQKESGNAGVMKDENRAKSLYCRYRVRDDFESN